MQFRIMPGLPPYGPPAISFPRSWERTGQEGLVVEFSIGDSLRWVGKFRPGFGALAIWILFLVACGSSTSPPSDTSEFTCDPPDACPGWTLSVNERLCPGRSSERQCGDLYKSLVRCLTTDCSSDVDAASGRCEMQAQAWQACNVDRLPDGG